MSENDARPVREHLIRAVMPGLEFRDATDGGDIGPGFLGTLRIRFSPVNEWTEINSAWEGSFMERFAPGAWRKTIRESADKIRSLFQHGMDPQIGDKPLGPFRTLTEDEDGGYAEVDLLDTSYNRDLLPGLKAGLYGASHRFRMLRETENRSPEPSEHNPRGLPERTITEAQLFELGPVTFPAYAGATAGMRSMTDEFLQACFRSQPGKLRAMFEQAQALERAADVLDPKDVVDMLTQEAEAPDAEPDPQVEGEGEVERRDGEQDAPSEDRAEPDEAHPDDERRDAPITKPVLLGLYGRDRKPGLINAKESMPRWHR